MVDYGKSVTQYYSPSESILSMTDMQAMRERVEEAFKKALDNIFGDVVVVPHGYEPVIVINTEFLYLHHSIGGKPLRSVKITQLFGDPLPDLSAPGAEEEIHAILHKEFEFGDDELFVDWLEELGAPMPVSGPDCLDDYEYDISFARERALKETV